MDTLPLTSFMRLHLDELKESHNAAIHAARLEFNTHKKAIEGIVSLKCENKRLRQELKLSKPIKKTRGQPRKQKSILAELGQPVRKKIGGRPVEHRDMENKIRVWDAEREKLAKELGKKSVTDLCLLEHLIDKKCKTMNRSEKASLKKTMRTSIKYLRDKTGVRIHKHKKAENPLK
ncbi:MAG: hypothetical protein EBR02_01990 [Alphaproteobacteria bacterium]|nr:hypothetical protein [Alphaproteobacteria bacterium]